MVNGAKGIEISDGAVHVQRESESGLETYALPMPAAVGVKEGINLPRYPTMKGRLASKRVGVVQRDAVGEPGGQQLIRLQRPAERVSQTTILGTGPDAAPAVVDLLAELGVLT